MLRRQHRPMFFIDMAVPRDIDPAIHTLDNVFLYDMDALENVVAAKRRAYQQAALVAEDLVWREVRHFYQWLAAREATPTIVALRHWAETTRREELDKALARIGPLEERQRRALEAFSVGLVHKLCHVPTVHLKRSFRLTVLTTLSARGGVPSRPCRPARSAAPGPLAYRL